MFREVLHRFVSYTKRVGRYTVKVECVDGEWGVWVLGPTLTTNTREDQLLFAKSHKLSTFYSARQQGLAFVRERAEK